jgi:ketosteroid isomerase-like protein
VTGAAFANGTDVGGDVGFDLIRLIGHAETAAEIEVADGHAVGAEAADEGEHGIERLLERRGVEQLRADVAADAFGDDVFESQCARVDFFCGGDIDAELVIAKAGGDVGVGLGVDVGVDADGDAGLDAEAGGDGIDERELGFRFAVEAVDAAGESVLHFFAGFADAGEDHLFRAAAGAENAVEFAAGDDVEAGAFGGQEAENAQVRVSFDGVEDFVGRLAEGFVVTAVALGDGGGGIDVDGGAGGAGDLFEFDVFDVQIPVAVGERGKGHQDTRRIKTVWSSNCGAAPTKASTSV